METISPPNTKKSISYIDPSESLAKELKSAKTKLGKLYDLKVDDDDDEVLDEKIFALKSRIKQLNGLLANEEEKKRITRKIERAKSIFRSLEATWPHMTDKEKQSVFNALNGNTV